MSDRLRVAAVALGLAALVFVEGRLIPWPEALGAYLFTAFIYVFAIGRLSSAPRRR